MDLLSDPYPELQPIEEVALDTVVSVVNRAKEQLGQRQTLKELARCRELFGRKPKLNITGLRAPLAITAEHLIDDTIRFNWKLTDLFLFCINYKGGDVDEPCHYYYYEAIFSQPTPQYPIPQATVTVYFRVQEKFTHPHNSTPVPEIQFRLEGQRTWHDIRYVTLIPEWLLAVIQMKIIMFKRIEKYSVF
ncbi:uncharacterized protein LOC125235030 [Leguminivora glycinivorella]|uniref:uncharacterized protein LOC125235030 n=1 Tax=Leguminivora glycinivorella TaxID=1035111 RepID=UPI00200CFE66|nr:uncharacterized protein LOC125235030 [Leguminivora glycinivorella]